MTKYSILSFYPQQIIQPLFLHVEVLNTKEDDCLVTMASKRHLRVASDVQLKVAAEKGYKVVASLDKVAEARGPSVVCHLLSSSRQQLPHLSCYININIVVDEERADMFLHHAPVPLAAEKKCSDRVDAGGGGGGGGGGIESRTGEGRGGDEDADEDRSRSFIPAEEFERESREEREARRQRDDIREERRRERERERRLEELERKGVKRSKLTRDRDRDVSEKIALGLAQPSGQDMQFDQRLFNQTSGMDSGFGAEDGYNVYDKRLFQERSSSVYRPKGNAEDLAGDEDSVMEQTLKNARFKVDNEFQGASGDGARQSRSGPVEFDRDEDVFGLDEFMQAAKKKGGQ